MAKASDQKGGRVRIRFVTPQVGVEPPELPGRIGVLMNAAGTEEVNLASLEDPDLIKDVTADTFDQVLAEIAPKIALDVDNVLGGAAAGKLHVELNFTAFEQFEPISIARQVPELQALLRKRERLNEWRAKLANKPKLAAQLRRSLKHQQRSALKSTTLTRKEG